ncbi:roadblock/LC7 domain-containing protein [Streptomyces sp. NPDC047072]|uniref:roadblock/LC7 domain-containing protein n=1 Tax=Streptomyces sp. NPDC047072 TaxID=3154809 RepID=UPI0034116A16
MTHAPTAPRPSSKEMRQELAQLLDAYAAVWSLGVTHSLPKRRRKPAPVPSPEQEPAVARQAANPRTAAGWRLNLHVGLQVDPSPTPRLTPEFHVMTHDPTTPLTSPKEVQQQLARLLDEYVADTPGATHALLASRDGMLQAAVTHMDRDWAEKTAAAFASVVSLARGLTGPTDKQMPAKQCLIDRDDVLFLATEAGAGSAFHDDGRTVATILVVFISPDADVDGVSFEAGRLVQRFAPFMTTPVRVHDGLGAGVE